MEIDKPFKIKNFILPTLKLVALSQYARTGKFPKSENISFMEQECEDDPLMKYVVELTQTRKQGTEYYESPEILEMFLKRWEELRQEAFKIETVKFIPKRAEKLFMEMVLE